MVYFTLEDYEEAIKNYEKAIAIYPQFYVALNNE
jgi:tetratricopeptide (TPR) repeat protein